MKVVFGGTFDPVHIGHLRMATELVAALGVDCVDLMPCYLAVHKDDVSASAEQRLNMLRLATRGDAALMVDERELVRGKESFTIDSLRELREEIGEEPLCLVMGTDSATGLEGWRSASEFAALTHVVVVQRPGGVRISNSELDSSGLESVLSGLGFSLAASAKDLYSSSCGRFLNLSLSQLDISSSAIRAAVGENKSVRYLVTDAVNEFICDNALYK